MGGEHNVVAGHLEGHVMSEVSAEAMSLKELLPTRVDEQPARDAELLALARRELQLIRRAQHGRARLRHLASARSKRAPFQDPRKVVLTNAAVRHELAVAVRFPGDEIVAAGRGEHALDERLGGEGE